MDDFISGVVAICDAVKAKCELLKDIAKESIQEGVGIEITRKISNDEVQYRIYPEPRLRKNRVYPPVTMILHNTHQNRLRCQPESREAADAQVSCPAHGKSDVQLPLVGALLPAISFAIPLIARESRGK